jgi:hypothetical protein
VVAWLSALASGTPALASAEGAQAPAAATVPPSLSRSYAGTVGPQRVMMRLEVKGAAVKGSYFLADEVWNGRTRALAGSFERGTLVLAESVGGKGTGSFEGTVAASGAVAGTWKSRDGRTQPVSLEPVAPGTPRLVTRHLKDRVPAAEPSGSVDHCEVNVKFLEIFGVADAAVEGAVNAALAAGHERIKRNAQGECEGFATELDATQKVKLQQDDLLVVEESGTGYGGGAHPWNTKAYTNLSLRTGRRLRITDVLKAGSLPRAKALFHAAAEQRFPDEGDRADMLRALEHAFERKDDLEFRLAAEGLYVSAFNELAYAFQALDEDGTLVGWKELGDLVDPESEAARLVRP